MIQVFVNFEESLLPWFESFGFIVNYPFLWLICYTQAYFFYQDFGGDQIFNICKQKFYDTYQTVWKSPDPVGEGVSDYWNDMTWDDEPEEKKYDYDDQYDNVDDNDMNLNNWNGRRLDDLFQ